MATVHSKEKVPLVDDADMLVPTNYAEDVATLLRNAEGACPIRFILCLDRESTRRILDRTELSINGHVEYDLQNTPKAIAIGRGGNAG